MTISSTTPHSLSTRAKVSHHLAVASYVLLLCLMVVSVIISSAPPEASRLLMYAVKLIPLVMFIPGLLKMSPRTHIWLCFMVLFYFTQSVVNVWLSQGNPFDVVTCITTVTLFIGSMMYVRWNNEGIKN